MVYISTLTNPLHVWLVAEQGNPVKCVRTASFELDKSGEYRPCVKIQYYVVDNDDRHFTYTELIFADVEGFVKFDGSLFEKLVKAGFKIELARRSGSF